MNPLVKLKERLRYKYGFKPFMVEDAARIWNCKAETAVTVLERLAETNYVVIQNDGFVRLSQPFIDF